MTAFTAYEIIVEKLITHRMYDALHPHVQLV